MRYFICLLFSLLLPACQSAYPVPPAFSYHEIPTGTFTLASWQKITAPETAAYKIYIEGDGHAFNSRGKTTHDPTPQQTTLRDIAFNDPSPNVIYLARPCQYLMSDVCSPRHWSSARFAPEVMNATAEAIQDIAGQHPVILIGYSGGAQIAGLVAVNKPWIKTKKLITIAGNLDHQAWTEYHHLPSLNESMSLSDYKSNYLRIPQIHYTGAQDNNIPPALTLAFVGPKHQQSIIIVEGAGHSSGFQTIAPQIWSEQ